MSLNILGRATVPVTIMAAIMVGLVPAPAPAAPPQADSVHVASAPVVDVFCESLGHYRVLCERTITGGTAPYTTKWYYNGNYFPSYDNKAFTGWSCTLAGPNQYKAVVTDATGLSGTDTSGVGCRSGNP
jgi:hypothetical protein